MTEYKYIDLTYYNNSKIGNYEIQNAEIKEERSDQLVNVNNITDYLVSVARFSICSNLIPVYIPNILNESEYNTITNQITDAYTGISLPTVTFPNFDLTDLFIIVKEGATIKGANVIWTPENSANQSPNGNINKSSVYSSSYYHCFNSLHVCKLIANTIASLFSGKCEIIKGNEGRYVLLLTTVTNLEISFSDSLHKLVPIHSVPNALLEGYHTIVFDSALLTPQISIGVPVEQYYSFTTSKAVDWLPFNKLLIKSGLPTVSQFTSSNVISSKNNTTNIMTDYSLENVTDPDIIYPKLIYQPQSYSRWISMKQITDSMDNYNLNFTLISPDNIEFPLRLKPKDYVNIKLVLKNN